MIRLVCAYVRACAVCPEQTQFMHCPDNNFKFSKTAQTMTSQRIDMLRAYICWKKNKEHKRRAKKLTSPKFLKKIIRIKSTKRRPRKFRKKFCLYHTGISNIRRQTV